jgi:hypothetical protein
VATRKRVLLGLLCAAWVSIAPGCCTLTLLGSLDAAPTNVSSAEGGAKVQTAGNAWIVALTPLAVGVDAVTLPLQLLLFSLWRPGC